METLNNLEDGTIFAKLDKDAVLVRRDESTKSWTLLFPNGEPGMEFSFFERRVAKDEEPEDVSVFHVLSLLWEICNGYRLE